MHDKPAGQHSEQNVLAGPMCKISGHETRDQRQGRMADRSLGGVGDLLSGNTRKGVLALFPEVSAIRDILVVRVSNERNDITLYERHWGLK
jgi:hypothetical protein